MERQIGGLTAACLVNQPLMPGQDLIQILAG